MTRRDTADHAVDEATESPGDPYVGQRVRRREDDRLLAGRGRFVADLVDRSTLHAVVVRSSAAAAMIVSVDTEVARAMPGVCAVVTGAELVQQLAPLSSLHTPHPDFAAAFDFWTAARPIPVCASERVLYVGEPTAVVVAETRAQAEDAAELVEVEFEALPPVMSASDALAPDAPHVHTDPERGNLAARLQTEFGDVDDARARAAVVVRNTYTMGRHGSLPLECRGVLADWNPRERRVHVWTSTQVPHLVRDAICASTGWTAAEVRVAVPDVGGGFGTKANVYPEEVLVPYLARILGRRVAWIEDRSEHFLAAAQGRDQTLDTELMVDVDGRLLGLSVDYVVDIGANSLWTAGIIANTALHLMGPYRLPSYRVRGRAAYTNKTVVAQYRGAGRPEACLALERSLDAAADRLGLDRAEIRRRNLLTSADLPYPRPVPYRDGVPVVYDGGDYRACLDAALAALPPATVDELRNQHPDLDLGWGVASYLEATGRGPNEAARLRLLADGRFELSSGAASAGQSHETTLVQIAADSLGVAMDRIVWHPSDTDRIAVGVGTFASRTAVVAGNAVQNAGERVRHRAAQLAATLLAVPAKDVWIDDNGVRCATGTASWTELARGLERGGALADEGGLDELGTYSPDTVTWTAGVHAAIVGVDTATGLVRVLRYAVAHEGAVEINPSVVEGQIRGGVAQGLGGALLESFPYSDEGQPLTPTFAEYLLPGTLDVPRIDLVALHTEATLNPLGVKGIGESGAIAVYAALASAIEDALPNRRGSLTTTPFTPADVIAICATESAPDPDAHDAEREPAPAPHPGSVPA